MRYERQTILSVIGEEGQSRIESARVAILGVGALGTVGAAVLCRAGVGFLRLVDRDHVDESNLQRGELFTEADAAARAHKATACARHLLEINQSLQVEPVVGDIDASNIEGLIADVDVVLDGADNFELRYLINDTCHRLQKPWVHGAVQKTAGAFMTITPKGPCLRCLNQRVYRPSPHSARADSARVNSAPTDFVFADSVPAGSAYAGSTCAGSTRVGLAHDDPTRTVEGVLGAITKIIASQQAVEALKLILGSDVSRGYHYIDCWHTTEIDVVEVQKDPQCPCCSSVVS